MAEVIWADLAVDDLRSIHQYVSLDSIKYADRLIDKITGRVDILIDHPNIGRKVPEINMPEIRELIEGSYRIIYYIDNEKDLVSVMRVHHSARLLGNL